MVALLLALAILLSTTAFASDLSVHVETEADNIVYGKTLEIQINADNISLPIQALRTKPLLRNFALEYIERDPGTLQHQSLWLRLHPRRSGKLTIPALQLLDVLSEPVDIYVNPPEIDGQTLTLTAGVDKNKVWQRQQVILSLDVYSPKQFYSLEFDELKIRGFELLSIPEKKSRHVEANKTTYHTQLGWVLMPLTADDYPISLPGIRYLEGGWKLFEFHTPQLNLSVKRLPSYIGPDIVVGRLNYQLEGKLPFFLSSQDMHYIRYKVEGRGILREWLPRLDDQFVSHDGLTFFPAIDQTTLALNFDGLSSQQDIIIPVQSSAFSWLQIPNIETQYFDPDKGKLQLASAPAIYAFSYSTLVLRILLGLAAIAAIGGLMYRRAHWLQLIRRLQQRRSALVRIKHATSTQELVAATRAFSQVWLHQSNPSLTQIFYAWTQRYAADQVLRQALQQLNQLHYDKPGPASPSEKEVEAIRHLAGILHQRFKRAGFGRRFIFSPSNVARHRPSRY